MNAAEKRKRGSGSASATDDGPNRKQQWYLTYLRGMSTYPCLTTSILGRESRHITSPPSPPKLSQQHHNRDTAIIRRVKPCRDGNEREKSTRLAKQDFFNGTENSIRSASRTYNILYTKLSDRLREQQPHSDAHRGLQLLSIRAMKAKSVLAKHLMTEGILLQLRFSSSLPNHSFSGNKMREAFESTGIHPLNPRTVLGKLKPQNEEPRNITRTGGTSPLPVTPTTPKAISHLKRHAL